MHLNLQHAFRDMKKVIVLLLSVCFFTTLCAGVLAHTWKSNPFSASSTASVKTDFSQKSDNSKQPSLSLFSEDQDTQDYNDLEKVKFDYSVLTQEWLHFFFSDSSGMTKVEPVQSRVYILAPRYILYHSLQIAGC